MNRLQRLILAAMVTAAIAPGVYWLATRGDSRRKGEHALASWVPAAPGAPTAPVMPQKVEPAPEAIVSTEAPAGPVDDFLSRYLAYVRQHGGPADAPQAEESRIISETLDRLDTPALVRVVRALREEPGLKQDKRAGNLGCVLQFLSRRDPHVALAQMNEVAPSFGSRDLTTVTTLVLPAVAGEVPEDTASWWMQHARLLGDSAERLRQCILKSSAQRHPDRTFQLIARLQITDLHAAGHGIGEAALTPAERTPLLEAMRRYLDGVPDAAAAENLRQGLFGGMSEGLHSQPLQESLTWAQSGALNPLEQQSLAEALEPYGERRAGSTQPQDMGWWLDWVIARAAPEKVSNRVEMLVNSWTRWFPAAAEQWVAGIAPAKTFRPAAIRGFVIRQAPVSLEDARRVALLLPEGGPRNGMLQTVEDARTTVKYGFLEERPEDEK